VAGAEALRKPGRASLGGGEQFPLPQVRREAAGVEDEGRVEGEGVVCEHAGMHERRGNV
jgi:hypothetical protein